MFKNIFRAAKKEPLHGRIRAMTHTMGDIATYAARHLDKLCSRLLSRGCMSIEMEGENNHDK